MRIGNYTIQGISKRFWFVLGAILLIPIVIFFLLPGEKVQPFQPEPRVNSLGEFFLDPEEYLSRVNPDYSWYPVGAQDREIFPGNDWDPEAFPSDTIKTRIYVPSAEQLEEIRAARPSLVYAREGISYYPVFAILPESSITEENRENWVDSFVLGEEETPVLQLASTEVLPSGEYDIRGLLYARSNFLEPQTINEIDNDSFSSWIPTVLLVEQIPVSFAEAEKPSQGRIEINTPIRIDPYEIIIQNFEWAPPDEVRLCLGVSNISNRPRVPVPSFAEDSKFYLTLNGTKYPLVLRDPERAPLSGDYTASLVRGSEAIFSYFVYSDTALSLPAEIEDIVISFPTFQGTLPISQITLSGDDLKSPGVGDRYRYRDCDL